MAKTAMINIRIEPEIKADVEKTIFQLWDYCQRRRKYLFAQIVDGRRAAL